MLKGVPLYQTTEVWIGWVRPVKYQNRTIFNSCRGERMGHWH